MGKIAGYVRISSRQQRPELQNRAIKAWAEGQGVAVRLYTDRFTGRTMDRPGWTRLEEDVRAGRVDTLVVWKLDRLGRTAAGLTALFDWLREHRVRFVSLTEGIDLATATGRMVAAILASVAEFETELRGERVAAGQAAARAAGRRWGGSVRGWTKLTEDQLTAVLRLHSAGTPKSAIARAVGLSWPTVRRVIECAAAGQPPRTRGS